MVQETVEFDTRAKAKASRKNYLDRTRSNKHEQNEFELWKAL